MKFALIAIALLGSSSAQVNLRHLALRHRRATDGGKRSLQANSNVPVGGSGYGRKLNPVISESDASSSSDSDSDSLDDSSGGGGYHMFSGGSSDSDSDSSDDCSGGGGFGSGCYGGHSGYVRKLVVSSAQQRTTGYGSGGSGSGNGKSGKSGGGGGYGRK
eukprot:72184_1